MPVEVRLVNPIFLEGRTQFEMAERWEFDVHVPIGAGDYEYHVMVSDQMCVTLKVLVVRQKDKQTRRAFQAPESDAIMHK